MVILEGVNTSKHSRDSLSNLGITPEQDGQIADSLAVRVTLLAS